MNEYITLPTRPSVAGKYKVKLLIIGKLVATYINGAFYMDAGMQIPDSIILGWKE